MNCRPDQLAIIIAPFPGGVNSVGRIVRTVRFLGNAQIQGLGVIVFDAWQVEHRGQIERQGTAIGVPDACLKPINDPGDDAVDETLIYAGDPRVREVQHG